MSNFNKLSHTLWCCQYHIVFCTKYRYRVLNGKIEEFVRNQIYKLVGYKKEANILELNIQEDHVHLVVKLPPKYSVSEFMGYLKGKLSLRLYLDFKKIGKVYWGRKFWSRGYCVSTVGLNEDQIRKYVRWQQERESKG